VNGNQPPPPPPGAANPSDKMSESTLAMTERDLYFQQSAAQDWLHLAWTGGPAGGRHSPAACWSDGV